jgi:hypothetical protein
MRSAQHLKPENKKFRRCLPAAFDARCATAMSPAQRDGY